MRTVRHVVIHRAVRLRRERQACALVSRMVDHVPRSKPKRASHESPQACCNRSHVRRHLQRSHVMWRSPHRNPPQGHRLGACCDRYVLIGPAFPWLGPGAQRPPRPAGIVVKHRAAACAKQGDQRPALGSHGPLLAAALLEGSFEAGDQAFLAQGFGEKAECSRVQGRGAHVLFGVGCHEDGGNAMAGVD
jgi:hypothetical protein